VYTHSMETIYLSLSAQVAVGTFFMKSPGGFHEKGTFSVHSFNDDYLSIPERPGSYKYLFHEIPVSKKSYALNPIYVYNNKLITLRRSSDDIY
jgi:hypothetical protein